MECQLRKENSLLCDIKINSYKVERLRKLLRQPDDIVNIRRERGAVYLFVPILYLQPSVGEVKNIEMLLSVFEVCDRIEFCASAEAEHLEIDNTSAGSALNKFFADDTRLNETIVFFTTVRVIIFLQKPLEFWNDLRRVNMLTVAYDDIPSRPMRRL